MTTVKILGVEGTFEGLEEGDMFYTFLIEVEGKLWNSTTGLGVDPDRVDSYVAKKALTLFGSPVILTCEDQQWRDGLSAVSVLEYLGGPSDSHLVLPGVRLKFWFEREPAETLSRSLKPDYWEFLDHPASRYDNMCLARAMGLLYLPAAQARPLTNLLKRACELGLDRDPAIEIIAEAARISRGDS